MTTKLAKESCDGTGGDNSRKDPEKHSEVPIENEPQRDI